METTTIKQQTSEILIANNLDFRIEKEALIGANGRNTPYFGLFNSKTNQCLNTTKEGYTVSQNDEIVELVLTGMQKFGTELKVSKAGALNGGGKVFIQLEINGVGKVANDTIKRYVTIIDSNDGSTALSIGIGDLTMSCSNQFFKFYKKGDAKFRHSASMQQKLHTIPYLIETALSESIKQIEVYNRFASTEISRNLANSLVKSLLGYDRVLTSIADLSEKSTQSINIMDKMYNHIDREIADKGLNIWGYIVVLLHTLLTKLAHRKGTTLKSKVC